MSHFYVDGGVISTGDRVIYGGKPATIVFIVEERSFSAEYKEEDWSYLGRGIGVKTDDGQLFTMDAPDEDLIHLDSE